MEDYLSRLNDQQRAAVEYLGGPELVIAGAGSGKTRVLTYKIVHLLARGYEPWRILALTFTNKAAREMRERIETLVGEPTSSKLWMGTFHSIFSRILRTHADRIGFTSNFTIYDSADSKSLVKMIIKDMQLDDKQYKVSTVLNAISWAKNALVSPGNYLGDRQLMDADRRAKRPDTGQIYKAYMDRCRVAGAMDFDDLLYYTNILLTDNPDVLRHYREFFRYVLVDEYQDTNFAQHRIIRLITQESGDLCVVGDDAQSIYSFRGANIRNILELKREYPTLEIFKLEQNYRSTQNIINAANTLIAKNSMQIPKEVFSRNDVGERIEVVKSYSDFEEGYLVANRISQVKMRGTESYDEFAILYRTNAQSRVLEESLRKRNIPYRIYGGLSFYQRKEIKDAISYLRLAINPDDDEAIKRVINTPSRGIGETTVKKIAAAAIEHHVSLAAVIHEPDRYSADLNKGTKSKLAAFISLVDSFGALVRNGLDADEMTRAVITNTGLLSMYLSDRTPESVSKQENLEELMNAARSFVTDKIEQGDDEHTSLQDFLGEVSLATDQDSDDETEGPKVTLMTIHAAKGLEFANVFIVGVEEELLPSSMSASSPQEIEEERRLLYVAITRAKKYCMMSYASSRFHNGQTKTCQPSRFIADIDFRYLRAESGSDISAASKSGVGYRNINRFETLRRPSATPQPSMRQPAAPALPDTGKAGRAPGDGDFVTHQITDLAPGMTIEHQRFGRGTITEVDSSQADHRIVVSFSNVQQRTLLLKFARFKILG